MLAKIESELCKGFERELFTAAQMNLKDETNPLRLNNYSYAMRELTRHVLNRLAPDKNVIKCSWYKNQTNNKDGITRKQRAYYAVQGGLKDSYVQNNLDLEAKKIHRELIDSINRLSKFTHIEPKVFNLPKENIKELVKENTEAVYDFLNSIKDCRKLIIDKLWEQIDSAVIDESLMETIIAIDELSTHHFIDEVYTDKIEIYEINHEFIMFHVDGFISCELQWGSNSDQRRGDGVILPQTFPFICKLFSQVDKPETIEIVEGSLEVDTSKWYEGRNEE